VLFNAAPKNLGFATDRIEGRVALELVGVAVGVPRTEAHPSMKPKRAEVDNRGLITKTETEKARLGQTRGKPKDNITFSPLFITMQRLCYMKIITSRFWKGV